MSDDKNEIPASPPDLSGINYLNAHIADNNLLEGLNKADAVTDYNYYRKTAYPGSFAGLFANPELFGPSGIIAPPPEILAIEEAAKLRRENASKEAELLEKEKALRNALVAKGRTEGELSALKSSVKDLLRDFSALQKQKDLGYLLERVRHATMRG